MEAHGDLGLFAENFDPYLLARLREDENESRSGSDNFDGVSGDDPQDGSGDVERQRKKAYHRHSQRQTQELESFFKECPHPDESQRVDLSRRLGLENRQVKFWFQNRRTQMKAQLERHENIILRQENDKLRAESYVMKEALKNPICTTCGGAALPGSVSLEEHKLKIDNARLREELSRVCALASKLLGRSLSSFDNTLQIPDIPNGFDHGVSGFNGGGASGVNGGSASALPKGRGIGIENGSFSSASSGLSAVKSPPAFMGSDDRSVLLDVAFNAMDELVRLAQAAPPLWVKTMNGEKEMLNQEQYLRSFHSCFGRRPSGYATEATRDIGMSIVSSAALADIITDANQWKEMFKGMIPEASIVEVVSDGINGSKNGAVLLMHAETQVMSPFVPIRRSRFLRFSKQLAPGCWAVVDFSFDNGNPFPNSRKLPSGIVVQDMPNGYSKIICIEHSEYDESVIHPLYKPLVSSGMAFGANRWISTLQRQCENFAVLIAPPNPTDDYSDSVGVAGKGSVWRLAQRMTDTFTSGICATGPHRWDKVSLGNLDGIRVMVRRNLNDPGEPMGVILSVATSVWMPVSRHTLFGFLTNEHLRYEWDTLANDEPMEEVFQIAKGQTDGNSISLLRTSEPDMPGMDSSTLILQDAWTDASSSQIVYASVDMHSMNAVLNGGESSYVSLLPSGFAIHPDSKSIYGNGGHAGGGSLLTFGIQIPINDLTSSKFTEGAVKKIKSLMTSMIQRIKTGLRV